MALSGEPQIVVGMLRGKGRPGPIALAMAHAAAVQGAKLYFFTPADVDTKNRTISGLFYTDGTWIRETTAYPDVLENDELARSAKQVWSDLTSEIPITTHKLGGKVAVMRLMQNAGLYPEMLIPGDVINRYSDFIERLYQFGSSVVKPARGAMGKDISFFSKTEKGFNANISGESVFLDNTSVQRFYDHRIRGRNYLHQKYIESRTSGGLPFDIRLHVRRDQWGEWKTVKIYARIGSGNSIASNLSAGGSMAAAPSFLRHHFGQKSEAIMAELTQLAHDFPIRFQKLYPDQMLDALGIDIGLDGMGKPWLFEVNSYPGAMFFELEDAVPRIGYAIYLAKRAKNAAEGGDLAPTDKISINNPL